jgi:hypothetical protein
MVDIRQPLVGGATPLFFAIALGNVELVRLLRKAAASPFVVMRDEEEVVEPCSLLRFRSFIIVYVTRCRCYKLLNIDYRCADGRFLVSTRGMSLMSVSNTKYLSSSETRVNAGKKDGNHTYLNYLDARNLLVVSVSQMSEAQLLYSLCHFQTTAQMQYFQVHLLA